MAPSSNPRPRFYIANWLASGHVQFKIIFVSVVCSAPLALVQLTLPRVNKGYLFNLTEIANTHGQSVCGLIKFQPISYYWAMLSKEDGVIKFSCRQLQYSPSNTAFSRSFNLCCLKELFSRRKLLRFCLMCYCGLKSKFPQIDFNTTVKHNRHTSKYNLLEHENSFPSGMTAGITHFTVLLFWRANLQTHIYSTH